MKIVMDMVRSRDQGRVIPGWQRGRLKVFRGVLVVRLEYQAFLHRHVHTARMRMEDRAEPEPPPLLEARIIELAEEYWTITGFERIDDGLLCTDYAQTWCLVPPRETKGGYGGAERI